MEQLHGPNGEPTWRLHCRALPVDRQIVCSGFRAGIGSTRHQRPRRGKKLSQTLFPRYFWLIAENTYQSVRKLEGRDK